MSADAPDSHAYQLPDAPPPPKLPPPPPLSLEPEPPPLQPPPPPDQPVDQPPSPRPALRPYRPAFWFIPPIASAKKVTADMMTPASTPAAIEPSRNQTSTATAPPAVADPTSRPSRRRDTAPMPKTAISVNGLNGLRKVIQASSEPCEASGRGAGSGSPSTTPIIRERPAAMPPAKSPVLKRGTITSSMMRRAVTSVSAPSRP